MSTAVVLTKDKKAEVEAAMEAYVNKVIFDPSTADTFEIQQENKLAFLQVTRPSWVKSRKIGGKYDASNKWVDETCDYIPIRKMERLLNFLFNFNWSSKVIEKEFSSQVVDKTKYCLTEKKRVADGTRVINEAYVVMEFTAEFFGKQVTKTVSGSWKMYHNDAVSKYAVIQASISQATKNFGKLYGIGADLNDDIEDRFSQKDIPRDPVTDEEVQEGMDGLLDDFNNNANKKDEK